MNPIKGILNPIKGILMPAEGIMKPSKGTLNPIKGNLNLTKGILKLTKGILTPSKGIPKPIKGILKPSKEILILSKGIMKPTKGIVMLTKRIVCPPLELLAFERLLFNLLVCHGVRSDTLVQPWYVGCSSGVTFITNCDMRNVVFLLWSKQMNVLGFPEYHFPKSNFFLRVTFNLTTT